MRIDKIGRLPQQTAARETFSVMGETAESIVVGQKKYVPFRLSAITHDCPFDRIFTEMPNCPSPASHLEIDSLR